MKEHHDVTEYWEGKRYLVLTFDWDYVQWRVHLSMTRYIIDALKRFKRKNPKKGQAQTHIHPPPIM